MEPAGANERYCPSCDRSYPDERTHCPKDGSELVLLAAAVDPLIGRDLDGRFKIVGRLGAGGMGAVYLAQQHSVGREVAIKIVRPGQEHLLAASKRFLREAKLASRLSQPNLVGVIDFGRTTDGLLYLVMERLRGRTLGQVLRAEGPFSVERMAHIGAQLCDALQAAHQLTIIHRDLKPANIMVLDEPRGRDLIKVLDFGLAKTIGGEESSVTESGLIVGTMSYLAPEVMEGGAADERADLYALGVLFYLMLSNRLPYKDLGELRSFAPSPLPDSVPPVLANLVARLLERDPTRRLRSAAQTREALKAATRDAGAAWLSSSPAEAPLPDEKLTALEIPRGRQRRGLPLWLGGAAALAAALAGSAVVLHRSNNVPPVVTTAVSAPAPTLAMPTPAPVTVAAQSSPPVAPSSSPVVPSSSAELEPAPVKIGKTAKHKHRPKPKSEDFIPP